MTTIELIQKYRHIFHTDYTADANCQAAWLFTEGSGTTVADSSQNSNTGNFKGDGEPAWDGTDKPDVSTYSVDFDGTDDYIDCGTSATLNVTGNFTIVLWFKTKEDYTTKQTLLGRDGWLSGSDNWGYLINFGEVDNKVWFRTFNNGATGLVNNTAISTDAWRHLGVTHTTNDESVIFLNGSSDSDASSDDSIRGTVTHTFSLGSEPAPSWYGKCLQTEIAVFDRVLDSTEINEIMDYGLQGHPYTKIYSAGNYVSLPSNDTDLESGFVVMDDYDKVATDDGDRFEQDNCVDKFAINLFKDRKLTQQQAVFTVTWNGHSNYAPSASPIILQIYNRTTPSWEEIARNDSDPRDDADITLTATIGESGQTLSDYYDSNGWIACRIYQEST